MKTWISIGDAKGVSCCSCGKRIELQPFIDHHNRVCTHCGVPCVFLLWEKWKQILPALAPSHVKVFIDWSQDSLDELEFSELLSFLDDIVGS
jgi:hypothetical protein